MSDVPHAAPWPDPAPQPAAVLRDEVAEHRVRRGQAVARVHVEELGEPEREEYELRLDAYQVQVEGYRRRLEDIAGQLRDAHRDGLTGTWPRHAGQQLLDEELRRADRAGNPVSIDFVDVDGLKARNDRLGHAAGDQALLVVAQALAAGLRAYDTVVRWGGDEFLCVLPGATSDEAVRRIDDARRRLAALTDDVTVSVGVVERRRGESAAGVVHRADQALYLSRGTQLVEQRPADRR